MNRLLITLGMAKDPRRDPLTKGSRMRRESLALRLNSLRYHAICNDERGWYYLCGCGGGIRGVHGFNKLGARRRRDYRWADRYRAYGRTPDRTDRW